MKPLVVDRLELFDQQYLKKVFYKRVQGRLQPGANKNGTSYCWVWTGGPKGDTQYGKLRVLHKTQGSKKAYSVYVHRLVYTAIFGYIPKDKVICHTCDNPRCCRPTHLKLGTQKENVQMLMARRPFLNAAKLNSGQVALVKRMLDQPKTTQREIAGYFGVSRQAIGAIKTGKTWRHLI